jgi:hypothetical protein
MCAIICVPFGKVRDYVGRPQIKGGRVLSQVGGRVLSQVLLISQKMPALKWPGNKEKKL